MCHVEAFGPVPTPPASCKVTPHLLSGARSSCTTCPSCSPCGGEGKQRKAMSLLLPGAGLSRQKGGKRNRYAMSPPKLECAIPRAPRNLMRNSQQEFVGRKTERSTASDSPVACCESYWAVLVPSACWIPAALAAKLQLLLGASPGSESAHPQTVQATHC